jgi:tetratricopeptide (TPR) repeat protein
MSQRKKTLSIIAVLLFLAFITPIFISGFINLKNAENANQAGQYKTASEFYAQAAKTFFWQNDLWEKAGIASAQAQDYPTAIFYLQKVNQLSEQGWAWLGASYFQTNDVEKAISTFENGLKENQSATLYRLLASAYRSQKNWESEKTALENQIQLDSQDAYPYYRLGILLMIFSPAEAYDKLNRASTLNVETDSAVDTLITALTIADTQNNESDKYVTIGRALGLVQEWDLAFVAFQKSIELNEENAEAWAWLGEAKQQQGQDGSVELNQALRLNHTSATVRGLRALYWNRQEKYAQMLAEYSLANEFEPTNPAWLAGIGEAHAKLGDLISALQAYQQAVELAPDDATYWRLLAMFCAENNFYIEEIGLPSAEQAVSLSSNDPANLDALGYTYFLSGRYSNAELTFLQAIELSPQYFPAHLHVAMNYLAQNNRTAAYNSLTFVRDADTSGEYRETAQNLLNQYFP